MGAQLVLSDMWEEEVDIFASPITTFRMADKAKHYPVLSQAEADQVLEGWKSYAKQQRNYDKTILSLFDESGVWSAPYVLAGYDVIQLDIQNGVDISELTLEKMHEAAIDKVDGVLAACPCTHFANSGARWFAEKDRLGVTQEGIDLVHMTMQIIDYYQPEFWCLENPIGRIQKLTGLPKARLRFQPHHFGDPWTKHTQLFGSFNEDLPLANVQPKEGSRVHKLRGDDPVQKKLRSLTPEGFAYAFFMANQI